MVVRVYFVTQSYQKVREAFPDPVEPADNTVMRLVKKFNENGSVNNAYRCGPPKTTITPEHVEEMRAPVDENPYTSQRRLAARTNISRGSVHRYLKEFKIKPYSPSIRARIIANRSG